MNQSAKTFAFLLVVGGSDDSSSNVGQSMFSRLITCTPCRERILAFSSPLARKITRSAHDVLDCLYDCADVTEMKEARLVPWNMVRVLRLPSKIGCVAKQPLWEAKDVLPCNVVVRIVKSKLLD